MMPFTVPETVYDSVFFRGSAGTLQLTDEQLCFHTPEKVSVLPWKKIVQRQVASASSKNSKPMFKLILRSGTEAVFEMGDRVSLEVLRDDMGERLKTWRRLNPQEENVAVNKTHYNTGGRRQSTPYRMVNASQLQRDLDDDDSSTVKHGNSRRASWSAPERAYGHASERMSRSEQHYSTRRSMAPQNPEEISASERISSTRRASYSAPQKPRHHQTSRRSSYHGPLPKAA